MSRPDEGYTPHFTPRRPRPRIEEILTIDMGGWRFNFLTILEFEGETANKEARLLTTEPVALGEGEEEMALKTAKRNAQKEALNRAWNLYQVRYPAVPNA